LDDDDDVDDDCVLAAEVSMAMVASAVTAETAQISMRLAASLDRRQDFEEEMAVASTSKRWWQAERSSRSRVGRDSRWTVWLLLFLMAD
jgi:hypothetical protein